MTETIDIDRVRNVIDKIDGLSDLVRDVMKKIAEVFDPTQANLFYVESLAGLIGKPLHITREALDTFVQYQPLQVCGYTVHNDKTGVPCRVTLVPTDFVLPHTSDVVSEAHHAGKAANGTGDLFELV